MQLSEAQGVKEDRRLLAGFICAENQIERAFTRAHEVRGRTKFSDWDITGRLGNLLICVRFSTHKNFEKLHFRRVEGVGLLEGSL